MSCKSEMDSIKAHVFDDKDLTEYLKKKGSNHNCYKYYSTISKIVSIRDNKCLYLSQGNNWNDITDRNNFNSSNYKKVNYGMCFSYSRDESVAMWMLYGGIKKESGMIDFTKKGIRSVLNTKAISLGYFDQNNNFVIKKVINRENFDLYCIDIIYYSENGSYYCITRSDERCFTLTKTVFDKLIGCKKTFPWQYENECRLICSIERDLLDETCKLVRIDLKEMDLGKSCERLYHGPNFSSLNTGNTLPSKMDNCIDWDLCDERCKLKKDIIGTNKAKGEHGV